MKFSRGQYPRFPVFEDRSPIAYIFAGGRRGLLRKLIGIDEQRSTPLFARRVLILLGYVNQQRDDRRVWRSLNGRRSIQEPVNEHYAVIGVQAGRPQRDDLCPGPGDHRLLLWSHTCVVSQDEGRVALESAGDKAANVCTVFSEVYQSRGLKIFKHLCQPARAHEYAGRRHSPFRRGRNGQGFLEQSRSGSLVRVQMPQRLAQSRIVLGTSPPSSTR